MENTFSASDSLTTWITLIVLFLIGVAAVAFHFPRTLGVVVIMAAALAEVYVIARFYMRLRSEDVLIWTLVLLPVLTVIILAFIMVPDVVRQTY